jgi:RimJ/RimL family protein N-acetyltransferase
MKVQPFTSTLKNGKYITIREAEEADAVALLATKKAYFAESDYLLTTPEEFTATVEENRLWIRSFAGPNDLLLLAIHEDQIIGNIDVAAGQFSRISHTALVAMALLKNWRNLGLGNLLLETAIDWAKQNEKLERLWLKVNSANHAALKLYQKNGFTEEGRQKGFFKISENNYADNILMMLSVK